MSLSSHRLSSEEIALDHTPLTFGKYRGQTPDEVSEDDPGYICWLYESVKDKPTCSRTLYQTCKDDRFSRSRPTEEDAYKQLNPLDDLDF